MGMTSYLTSIEMTISFIHEDRMDVMDGAEPSTDTNFYKENYLPVLVLGDPQPSWTHKDICKIVSG